MNAKRDKESGDHAKLNDSDLVAGFRREEVSDEEIMGRLLEKVGMSDKGDEPLVRRDGSPMTGEDEYELRVKDYLKIAGDHPGATEAILNFVAMDESDNRFPIAQKAVASMVAGYLSPGA